jgi:transposase-like protein
MFIKSESDCILIFRQHFDVEKIKFTCDCGSIHRTEWLKEYPDSFNCMYCNKKFTIKDVTILKRSRLPYSYWLYAIYMFYKEDASARSMQFVIGHNRYESIRAMLETIKRNAEPFYKRIYEQNQDLEFLTLELFGKEKSESKKRVLNNDLIKGLIICFIEKRTIRNTSKALNVSIPAVSKHFNQFKYEIYINRCFSIFQKIHRKIAFDFFIQKFNGKYKIKEFKKIKIVPPSTFILGIIIIEGQINVEVLTDKSAKTFREYYYNSIHKKDSKKSRISIPHFARAYDVVIDIKGRRISLLKSSMSNIPFDLLAKYVKAIKLNYSKNNFQKFLLKLKEIEYRINLSNEEKILNEELFKIVSNKKNVRKAFLKKINGKDSLVMDKNRVVRILQKKQYRRYLIEKGNNYSGMYEQLYYNENLNSIVNIYTTLNKEHEHERKGYIEYSLINIKPLVDTSSKESLLQLKLTNEVLNEITANSSFSFDNLTKSLSIEVSKRLLNSRILTYWKIYDSIENDFRWNQKVSDFLKNKNQSSFRILPIILYSKHFFLNSNIQELDNCLVSGLDEIKSIGKDLLKLNPPKIIFQQFFTEIVEVNVRDYPLLFKTYPNISLILDPNNNYKLQLINENSIKKIIQEFKETFDPELIYNSIELLIKKKDWSIKLKFHWIIAELNTLL